MPQTFTAFDDLIALSDLPTIGSDMGWDSATLREFADRLYDHGLIVCDGAGHYLFAADDDQPTPDKFWEIAKQLDSERVTAP